MKTLPSYHHDKRPPAWSLLILFSTAIIALCCVTKRVAAAEKQAPFSPGEKLTYQLNWGFIPAGEAALEVLPMETIDGKPVYHFVATAKSNAFVDVFYTVRDRVDAYVDTDVTHTVFFKKKQREGKTRRDVVVNFDWGKMEAQYSNFNQKIKPISILPGTLDPLSAFFHVRLRDLKPNQKIERPVTDGKKCVVGIARVIKKEKMKLLGKTYDTYVLEPELKHIGGIFEKSKDAKIRLWVTADERRILLKVKSKVKIGSFTGELISATSIGE
ncbi:DUF3108 domain-containing protein [Thermodesulfobacteriota bacterium]